MIKQLQNKKVVNPQSRGGSTARKLSSINIDMTKVFIFVFLLGFWRAGEGQSVFLPDGGAISGEDPVIINTANPIFDPALITDGQIYFNSLNTGTLLINFLGRDGTGKIYEQQGSLPDLGTLAGQTLYWNGGVSWLPTDFLHVDPVSNFVGVNTSIPLPPTTYNIQSDFPNLSWNPPSSTPTINPYLTVKGGDIETDGNYYGNDIYVISDARLKKDIKELSDWKKMFEIKPYSYRFINRESKISYGFLAQDVQKVFPELTSTWREGGSVNYIGFIPFLAQGLKEHEERLNTIDQARKNILEAEQEISVITTEIQKLQAENQILNGEVENLNNKVETLESQNENLKGENQEMKDRLTALEEKFNAICNLPCIQNTPAPSSNVFGQTGTLTELPILEQNEPNPFTQETIIRYFLPESSTNAKIEVRNVENKVVGSFPISQFGHGNITISAGTLTVGNYFYSLIINGNVVETKRMTLLN